MESAIASFVAGAPYKTPTFRPIVARPFQCNPNVAFDGAPFRGDRAVIERAQQAFVGFGQSVYAQVFAREKAMRTLFIATLLAAFASQAQAQEKISGKAIALDGDTLLVTTDANKAVKVRLWGIDAPEMQDWPWGPFARGVLDEVLQIVGNEIQCTTISKRDNRVIARCWLKSNLNENDLSRVMVRSGAAVADRSYSMGAFLLDEKEARGLRNGIWSASAWDKWALIMPAPKTEAERHRRLKMLDEMSKPRK